MVDNSLKTFKVCIVGESGVGKTCLVERFVHERYTMNSQATIGSALLSKTLDVHLEASCQEHKVKLQLWDTAGQDVYRSITATYYRGADCVIMVYDSTSYDSFEELNKYWAAQVKENCKNNVVLCLAASKVDWAEREDVGISEASKFAQKIGAKLYQTSAKDGTGIQTMFEQIAQVLVEQQILSNEVNVRDRADTVRVSRPGVPDDQQQFNMKEEKKGGCCK